jgi:ligand-binding sensor domain-containing protein
VNPAFRHLDVTNGLQSTTVYDIKVLNNKLLYIAHEKGFSSFDGTRFVNYPNRDYPFAAVTNILQTDDGTVWCKSFNNYFYRLENNELHFAFKLESEAYYHYSSVIHNTIVGIFNDKVYTHNTKEKITKYRAIDSLPDYVGEKKSVFGMIFFANGKTQSVVLVDEQLNFTRQVIENKYSRIYSYQGNDKIFIQEKNDVLKFEEMPSRKIIECKNLNKKIFVNNVIQLDSILWVCTTTGVYRLDAQHDFLANEVVLEDYNVSSIQKDCENNYWFSTIGEGLFMIPNFNISALKDIPNGITSISGNDEKLFVGNKKGEIFDYSFTKKKVTTIGKSEQAKSVENIYFDKRFKTLIYSHANISFIQSGKMIQEGMVLKDVCIFQGASIFATNRGLFVNQSALPKNSWLQRFTQPYASLMHENKQLQAITFANDRTLRICADTLHESVYFSKPSGTYCMNKNLLQPLKILDDKTIVNDLMYYRNQLFIASKNKGLCVFEDGKVQSFKPDSVNEFENIIQHLHIFDHQLWIQSEDGIYAYDGKNIKKYSVSDGIPISLIKDFYVFQNMIYLNTGEQILCLPENRLPTSTSDAHLILQQIKNNQNCIPINPPFTLGYKNNNLLIDYSLIAYGDPLNATVEYSINNEGRTRLSSAVRNISLSALSSGHYTVSIYPVVNNQVIRHGMQEVVFTIATPFWKTWWFLGLLVLLFGWIVFKIVMQRFEKQKKENELIQSKLRLEKELDRSMLSSIKAQMNPHFLFNALNTVQSFIYSNDKQNASVYISKFSDLTRSILEMSTKDTISLDEEIKSLHLYLELEKMRFEDSFTYSVIKDKKIDSDQIKIPSMLVQPYVENAIKHGLLHKKTNRVLAIEFTRKQKLLLISIDDNGVGRKRSGELNQIKNRQHNSFAMDANKKRLEILKNNFNDIAFEIIDKYGDLGEPIGTCVIITLPIV